MEDLKLNILAITLYANRLRALEKKAKIVSLNKEEENENLRVCYIHNINIRL